MLAVWCRWRRARRRFGGVRERARSGWRECAGGEFVRDRHPIERRVDDERHRLVHSRRQFVASAWRAFVAAQWLVVVRSERAAGNGVQRV